MPFIGGEWVNYLIYVSPYFRIIDFILGMMLYLGMKANISENHRPVSATILEIPFFVYLGSLSFPIYMIHYTIRVWWRLIADRFGMEKVSILGAIICLSITMVLAYQFNSKIEPLVKRKFYH